MKRDLLEMTNAGSSQSHISTSRFPLAVTSFHSDTGSSRRRPEGLTLYATPYGSLRRGRGEATVSTPSGRAPKSPNEDEDWNETLPATLGHGRQPRRHTSDSSRTVHTNSPSTALKPHQGSSFHLCRRYAPPTVTGSVWAIAFLSPIVMVCLPLALPARKDGGSSSTSSTGGRKQTTSSCDPDCEGQLISLSVKLLILLIGSWALFPLFPRATLPRFSIYRLLVLFLILLLTVSFWLFYGVRILKPGVTDYRIIVGFSSSLVDTLLFVHYLAVILLRVRSAGGQQFVVKVVRSPDGGSRSYSFGQMSIQNLAVRCLQNYYRDFPVYNTNIVPCKQNDRPKSHSSTEFNYHRAYRVDGGPCAEGPRAPSASASDPTGRLSSVQRRHRGEEDVDEEEEEEERDWRDRVERRRMRLVVAAEDAFSRVVKIDVAGEHGDELETGSVDVEEAAMAIFARLARPLHRYLRALGARSIYTKSAVLAHISLCLRHDMTSRAFLEFFLRTPSVAAASAAAETEGGRGADPEWVLVSSRVVNSAVEDSVEFELRMGDEVRLLVTVRELPYLTLTEERSDVTGKRFILAASNG